ncbi:MAG: hypothetical protein G8345_04190 [Magnetococcales bacterium]|nr:hypothetical protein [Magnetococcales bacterium]
MGRYATVVFTGLAAMLLGWFYFDNINQQIYIEEPKLSGVIGQIASIGSSLLGFILAAMAILASLLNRPFIETLRRSGHFQQLVSELAWSSWCFFASILFSMITMFISSPDILQWIFPVAISSFTFGMSFLAVALYHFFLVLKYLD